ncbi:TldD/PmbA family protein [Imhoffiella purpurea]|uniref:TldE/PmbA family protein, Beta/Gamma-proteobacterial subgroup n=1 Tax=Imhoffiella purpurea TaxID=1249627 RepID=W9VJM7_9GAMM|nr:metallopeptidase TldD-related protein [Imhoffiella purpurea]EXJ16272.1 TldE/PmbA family protein, Beta/Gamma-proteobacterial subgroup [Imhoffiella purpurea]
MNQEDFQALSDRLFARLSGGEVLFCSLGGETSDFVRLTRNRIRQAGHLHSFSLGLTLISGARQAEGVCDLTGQPGPDLARAARLLQSLRERIGHVPEDPYLNYSVEPTQGARRVSAEMPSAEEALSDLVAAAEGLDLVGIWAGGEILEALSSSIGHRHWHQSTSFNLDWSGYLEADKALKSCYGGFSWDPSVLRGRLDAMRDALKVMERPAMTIAPGRYRAYFAPAAVQELMEMLAWGGFDLKSHRTQQTPLLKLVRGERRLDPRIGIREESSRGLAAGFTAEGFLQPDSVTLIEKGAHADCLVDARSAKEYGGIVNAGGETPESLALDAGDLPLDAVPSRLGTGLYIGNLWYCNWSDANECRITGMTRFGTFWVENGEIQAPVKAMRFDDSLYHLLGDRLEGLTRERELILSADTYDGRSTGSALLPGLLVSGIDLAL